MKLGHLQNLLQDVLGAETREKKGDRAHWERLRKEWNARLTDKERDVGWRRFTEARACLIARGERGEAQAADHATAALPVREAVVLERKVLTEVL